MPWISLLIIGRTAVKDLAQSYSSRKWQGQNFNSGSPTLSYQELLLLPKPVLSLGDHQ